ncbi:MAG: hypothetical protein ABFD51_06370 [Anaerolineaceae bacterium]
MGVPRFGAHAMRPYVARRSGSGATVPHPITTETGPGAIVYGSFTYYYMIIFSSQFFDNRNTNIIFPGIDGIMG